MKPAADAADPAGVETTGIETPPSIGVRIAAYLRGARNAGPRVWALVIAIVLASAWSAASAWGRSAPEPSHAVLPWILIVAFVLVESFPVHLQFRSEVASFSMLEIPIVIGLFTVSGSALLLAIGMGALIPLALIRRQQLVKLTFNLANLILQASVAVLLFDVLRSGDSPLSLNVAVAAMVATSISSALNVLMLTSVILASEGSMGRGRFANTLAVALIVGVTNTSLGLVALVLFESANWAIVLLVIPLTVLLGSYRAFVSERTQREQVEFLYSATKSLRANDEREVGIEMLVQEAASMFRATQVHLLLFPASDGATPAMQFDLRGGGIGVHRDENPSLDRAMVVATEADDARLVTETDTGMARQLLDDWGTTEGMVTALTADDKVIGLLCVGDRVGTVGRFGAEDLRLFDTLAYHASTALENDRLGQALVQLQNLERELSHLATHDPLTGLPNRLQLRQHLDQLAERGAADFELMFIDLDNFKFVNDTYGHAMGDELLRVVGQRIGASLRSTDVVARLGGDEFAVVVSSLGEGQGLAERIIESISQPIALDDNSVAVGCSIGIAVPSAPMPGTQLLRHADVAMYAAKNGGKGRFAYYSPKLGAEIAAQQVLQQRVRAAFASGELRVHYQPVYDITDNRMAGAEALIRWYSAEGIRPAEDFLSVVEEGGFINQLDRHVLTSVLADLRVLGDEDVWHSVNLSARSLQDDDVVDFVINSTVAAGIDPERIIIEITETAAIHNIDDSAAKLERLADAGFVIALDDFGTGFSSINHLRRLPVGLLKIAQPFVADLGVSDGETFIKAMVDLGHTLGLDVIAEGIESHHQLSELRLLGCDLGQGYLLDQPMPADALRKRIAGHAPSTLH